MADATLGSGLPNRLLRRDVREGPRGPVGEEPRRLPGDGRHRRRRARGLGDLVAGNRGREVLADRPQRPASPGRRGRPHRLRRRPEGLSRSHRSRVPPGVGADLHRARHPRLVALRQLPRPQEGRRRAAADLHRRQRRRGRHRARALPSRVGRRLPDDRRRLAARLDQHHPVPVVARRPASRGLHDG
jgi:hypothetical protein